MVRNQKANNQSMNNMQQEPPVYTNMAGANT